MQSARQFVEDYLKKQVRFYEIVARSFREGYILFDAEQAKAEVVLDASESKEDALVITSGQGEGYRTRYALRREDEGWSLYSPLRKEAQDILGNAQSRKRRW